MAIVYDLDKTLVSVNTFPRWIKFLVKKSIVHKKVALLLRLICFLFLRKINLWDHTKFKSMLCKLKYSKQWDIDFSDSILPYANKKLITQHPQDQEVIIATAAPITYAEVLGNLLFAKKTQVFASQWISNQFINNFHQVKCNRIIEYLGEPPTMFYTDSLEEDGPLVDISKNHAVITKEDFNG